MSLDITPMVSAGRQVIQNYGSGQFMISGVRLTGPALVFPERSLAWNVAAFDGLTIDDFAGDLRMHDLWCDELQVSTAKVWARPVPHTSATSGYRVEVAGKTVVYIPDHQQPIDDSTKVADTVLELCDGADLLIHDGQYPQALFDQRAHWGHSTPDYAVEVARQSGVSSLALFSHDPSHTDEELAGIEQYAQDLGEKAGLSQVFSAREGVRIPLAELPV